MPRHGLRIPAVIDAATEGASLNRLETALRTRVNSQVPKTTDGLLVYISNQQQDEIHISKAFEVREQAGDLGYGRFRSVTRAHDLVDLSRLQPPPEKPNHWNSRSHTCKK